MLRLRGRSDQKIIQIKEIKVKVSQYKMDESLKRLPHITESKKVLGVQGQILQNNLSEVVGSMRGIIYCADCLAQGICASYRRL